MKLKFLFFACFCISILHAQITIAITGLSPSCSQPCNGSITFTASGGTAPYTYTLMPSSQSNTTGVFNNVCAGSFTVAVVDANNSSATFSNSLPVINAPVITNVTHTAINAPFNYRAQANYTGGQPRYFVTWVHMPFWATIRTDTVSTMNDTLSQLIPGDYGVFVTDSINTSNNCISNISPFPFSICDPAVGAGMISVLPNDTVCSGTSVTITYTPILFVPVGLSAQIFSSDNSNCDPSQSGGSYSCNITQTTTFSGAWFYAQGCGPVVYTPLTVTVIPCTGVAENSAAENDVTIFPNPGTGVFTFTTAEKGLLSVSIFDATGRNCFSSIIQSGQQISPELSAGIYFCRIETENGVVTKKLVVTEK